VAVNVGQSVALLPDLDQVVEALPRAFPEDLSFSLKNGRIFINRPLPFHLDFPKDAFMQFCPFIEFWAGSPVCSTLRGDALFAADSDPPRKVPHIFSLVDEEYFEFEMKNEENYFKLNTLFAMSVTGTSAYIDTRGSSFADFTADEEEYIASVAKYFPPNGEVVVRNDLKYVLGNIGDYPWTLVRPFLRDLIRDLIAKWSAFSKESAKPDDLVTYAKTMITTVLVVMSGVFLSASVFYILCSIDVFLISIILFVVGNIAAAFLFWVPLFQLFASRYRFRNLYAIRASTRHVYALALAAGVAPRSLLAFAPKEIALFGIVVFLFDYLVYPPQQIDFH